MSPFRHNLTCICFLFVLCGTMAVAAAKPIQPFDAVVQTGTGDEALVRSGPGTESYYATLKLSPGDKVHVLRKDPGGWYMIDPPPGSFSWVNGINVERTGNQGRIKANGVVVRVGAFNSTQRDVEQVRLNTGDTVEIIGDETIKSDKGHELWLKIKSPRGEHRWIKGSHLVELNPDGSPKVLPKNTARKPIEKPDEGDSPAVAVAPTKPRGKSMGPAILRDPGSEGEDAPLYGSAPGKAKQNSDPFSDLDEPAAEVPSEDATIREDLALLDQELKDILAKPAKDWNFSNQFEDLRALKEMSGKGPLTPGIDRRLAKVEQYQKIHEDAAYIAQRLNSIRTLEDNRTSRDPSQSPGSTAGGMIPNAQGIPRPKFQGAGIVHRLPNAQPGMPRYVIAAPDRRILCYLDSEPGIDLDRFVGQSMGLNGPRAYDARLRADRMRVQKLTPVQLAP